MSRLSDLWGEKDKEHEAMVGAVVLPSPQSVTCSHSAGETKGLK